MRRVSAEPRCRLGYQAAVKAYTPRAVTARKRAARAFSPLRIMFLRQKLPEMSFLLRRALRNVCFRNVRRCRRAPDRVTARTAIEGHPIADTQPSTHGGGVIRGPGRGVGGAGSVAGALGCLTTGGPGNPRRGPPIVKGLQQRLLSKAFDRRRRSLPSMTSTRTRQRLSSKIKLICAW